jgi:hypothetical protein
MYQAVTTATRRRGIVWVSTVVVGITSLWPIGAQFLALATPTHRPMEEMHGGCASYQMNLEPEFRAMSGFAQPVMTWPAQGEPRALLSLLKPIAATLLPLDHVSLTIEPKRPGAYAGIVGLRIPTTGHYRVSLSASAWIEIVTETGRIEPIAFEMQSHCPTLFKTILYSLEAGTFYWLETSASSDELTILLTPEHPAPHNR